VNFSLFTSGTVEMMPKKEKKEEEEGRGGRLPNGGSR